MTTSWFSRAVAASLPALAAVLALRATASAPVRVEAGGLAWRMLVRGAAPDGTVRDVAVAALPGLSRERSVAVFVEAASLETGPSALGIGVDGGPLERARLEAGGIASRIPPGGTRGARLELRPLGARLRLRALEVRTGPEPWRVLPALLLPPLLAIVLGRRQDARLALALALAASATLLVFSAPLLDLASGPRALAWTAPAALAAAAASACARGGRGRALIRGALLIAAFVLGAWARMVFLPSAGSWDMEYWKAWTARADAHGVARVYGDADAVPPGRFLAQLRGTEPLWLVSYRGRDFVVDYPPLAMALWRWSWRAVAWLAPELDHGEAENIAVKLPAVVGDLAAVLLLLALFRATPSRAAALAAAYWALPVSWLSSGVLGFLDGALAVLVVASVVAAGRGRALGAGVALALAALVKPTALVAAPAVWCALAARRASPWRAIAGGAGTVILALVPFAIAGTLQAAIVHVYRILFQGTLSGGFPNAWWLLGHALTVAREGAPALGPVRFARLDLLRLPARPLGTLLFLAAAALVWRAQRGRPGSSRACLAGAMLVLAYGMCAVGVHENHPHPLFLLLFATGLATPFLRALAAGCGLVYVVNMLALSGIGRFYGPRHEVLEPAAHALARMRMALGLDLTLVLALVQIALFAWAFARLPAELAGMPEGATGASPPRP